jgi:hypothetical protein
MSDLGRAGYHENVLVLNTNSMRHICQRLDLPEPQEGYPVEPLVCSIIDSLISRIENLEMK